MVITSLSLNNMCLCEDINTQAWRVHDLNNRVCAGALLGERTFPTSSSRCCSLVPAVGLVSRWPGFNVCGIDVPSLKPIQRRSPSVSGPSPAWHLLFSRKPQPFMERVSISRQSQEDSWAESIFHSGKRSKHNWGKSIAFSRFIVHHLSLTLSPWKRHNGL